MKNKYDFIKAMTILLVVLGHVTNHYNAMPAKVVTITIYLFHMSLFVAVSGALYRLGCEHGKYAIFLPFVTTKAKRLLMPFCATAILVLAPTLVFCRMSNLGFIKTVINIFMGGVFVKHLWYLQALIWIFLVAWLLSHYHANRYLVFVISAALAVVALSLPFDVNRYFSIGMAINYFPKFILGMILLPATKPSWRQIAAWTAGCLFFGTVQIVSKLTLIDTIVSNLFSASIIGLLFALAEYAYEYLKASKVLAFLSKQSFGIYLFHMTPIYLLRYWGCDNWPLWISVPVTFILSLAVSIAFTIIIRACHLQILIGEK